jgi:hypothetical protein
VVLTRNARLMLEKGVPMIWFDACGLAKHLQPIVAGVLYAIQAGSIPLHASFRYEIRQKRKIAACCPCCFNGFCEDVLCVAACTSCALTQEKRELESMPAVAVPEKERLINTMGGELDTSRLFAGAGGPSV